jgi:citronellol/citronellal dehydrogenase
VDEPRRSGLSAAELGQIEMPFRDDALAGTAVVISGGAGGIGMATALLVTRLGARVLICGRDERKLRAAAAEIGESAGREPEVEALTIRDPDQVEALADIAFERLGTVDALVNSAGGQFAAEALDISVNGWDAVIDTNLNGTWRMIQAFGRRWRDAGLPAQVVNVVLSIDRGIPQFAHSCAARAGVVYLSRTLAVEWAPLGIRINCVAPGEIASPGLAQYPPEFLERFGTASPLRRPGETTDIAAAIIYLLATSGNYVTGELLHVDGGMHLQGEPWPLGKPDFFADR